MSTILTLVGKDFKVFWKDKVAVIMTFAVPMVLMTIFGMIFGGFGDSGPAGVRVIVVDEAQTEASRTLVDALKAEDALRVYTQYRVGEGEHAEMRPFSEEEARSRLKTNADRWRFVVIFPKDFEKEDFGFRLRYLYNPRSEVEYQVVTGMLQRTFFANAFPIMQDKMSAAVVEGFGAEGVVEFQDKISRLVSDNFEVSYESVRGTFKEGSLFPSFEPSGASDAAGGSEGGSEGGSDPFSFLLDLEDEQIAGKGKPPAAQSVGSWAVMFLLFTMTGAASALFEERDQGVFQRLLSGPVSRAHILWSKFLFLSLLGMFQLTVLFSFGQAVFGVITSVSQLLPLVTVCLVGAGAATGFGMVLCAFSKTPAQANGLGTLLILSMSALGGAMVPSFMFPAFLRDYVSPFSLVHWMMDGILKVLWEDAHVVDLWLNLVILAGIAVLTLSVALLRFRRGDLFR